MNQPPHDRLESTTGTLIRPAKTGFLPAIISGFQFTQQHLLRIFRAEDMVDAMFEPAGHARYGENGRAALPVKFKHLLSRQTKPQTNCENAPVESLRQ